MKMNAEIAPSQTVESRRIPQVIKAACQLMQVSDENNQNAEQSYFYFDLFVFQVGIFESEVGDKSNSTENEIVSYCKLCRF